MGTMSAFVFSFWVLCSVWCGVVRLGEYCSEVLWQVFCTASKHRSSEAQTGHLPVAFHVWEDTSPELPSNTEDKALYLSFVPVDYDNPEIQPCFCREAKVLKPPAAVMQCFLLSRMEIRGSTWILFLFNLTWSTFLRKSKDITEVVFIRDSIHFYMLLSSPSWLRVSRTKES